MLWCHLHYIYFTGLIVEVRLKFSRRLAVNSTANYIKKNSIELMSEFRKAKGSGSINKPL